MEVVHTNYRVQMGRSEREHNNIKSLIATIIVDNLTDSEVIRVENYNLNGQYVSLNTESEKKLFIVGNAAPKDDNICEDVTLLSPLLIAGQTNDFTKFLGPSTNKNNTIILSENNIPLAEYSTDCNVLYILFDLFGTYDVKHLDIFKYIICQLNDLVYKPRLLKYSWKNTPDKKQLSDSLLVSFSEAYAEQIRQDKRTVQEHREHIVVLTREIKVYVDRLNQRIRVLTANEENSDKLNTKFFKDLDLIITHPKVTDLIIKDGMYTVNTVPLRIYTDEGRIYQAGAFRITINMKTVDVRFFSDLGRRGFWTEKDPHPHVDGSNGEPCLGNLSPTVAELCSQSELYALVVMLIDYLESVNQSDSAGMKIIRWDEIDEEGNVIRPGHESSNDDDDDEDEHYDYYCDRCDEGCWDRHTVFDTVRHDEEGSPYADDQIDVCTDCFGRYYRYDDELEEYIPA